MNHVLLRYGFSLSASGLLIHFKPPPTFTQARVHLQADQGRSCVHCSYCSMSGRHVLAYFLFLLAALLWHALPIKHVNVFWTKATGQLVHVPLNESHALTLCRTRWFRRWSHVFPNMQLRIMNLPFIALPNCQKQLNRQFTKCQFHL